MWASDLMGMKAFNIQELKFDHLDREGIIDMPAIPYGTVLGKRAEHYFAFAVEQSSNFELIAQNIQIFENSRTLGELDFLIRDKSTGRVLHIELVFKFYIITDQALAHSDLLTEEENKRFGRFIGPAGRDAFTRKLVHLRQHQLPMLYHEATFESLKHLDFDVDEVEQRVCFMGQTFTHTPEDYRPISGINKESMRGCYLGYSAFAKAKNLSTNTQNFYLPTKEAWPQTPTNLPDTLTVHDLLNRVGDKLKKGFPSMVWEQLPDGSCIKYFIISDDLYTKCKL